MNQPVHTNANRGFTLVEALVTLTLVSTLLTAGVSTMSRLIASSRITSEINHLTAHLQLARSEAVKTGQRAVLCPSSDGSSCLGSQDWAQGYMVFVDADADRERDPGETIVHVHQIDSDVVKLNAGQRKTVTYQATGWAPGSNLTIAVCDAGGNAQPKAVIVSMTGRPRVDTIHPNGGELSCS